MSEKIQGKVSSLLERASHPGTDEHERELCIKKADELMAKYRIDRAMINFQKKETRQEIQSKEVIIPEYFIDQLGSLIHALYRHSGCKTAYAFRRCTAVGYPDDLFYADMLWNTVHMEFASQMFPSWDESDSFEANVYRLKEAGFKWSDIRDKDPSWKMPELGLFEKAPPVSSKYKTAYTRYCKKNGIVPSPHTQRHEAYRLSYAESFASTLRKRLNKMDQDNKKAEDDAGEEAALAIISDKDRIEEEFYRLFPNLRPMTDEERAEFDREQEERRKAEEERRAKMTQKQRDEEDRRNERDRRRARRAFEKSRVKVDQNGWNRGHEAASNVDLSGGGNKMGTGRAGELQ